MPYKTAKLGKRDVSRLPDASGTNFVSPASAGRRGVEGASATKPSSSSPKKKPRVRRSASFSDDSDAYAAGVVASSSSFDDESDVFDPTQASDPESETAQRRSSRVTTASSAADSPLESELDEEDLDIGLNYHAKSVSPKKKPSSGSPKKTLTKKSATTTPSGKNGKRKRDDYSDAVLADSEEDGNSDTVKIEVASKFRRLEKKGATKSAPAPSAKGKKQPVQRQKKADNNDDDSDDERFTVVGKIVQAPTTGRVPPGRISQNTLDFLSNLTDPARNDREWFRLHEPVYRLAEKEWKSFMEVLIPMACEVDEQLPPLPPNDVVHRIYRDIRFSNDKTPYKRNFSASMSRTGRKGKFAGLRPGGSLIAAGLWAPERDTLLSLRTNILHDATPLREAISRPRFVKLFGEAKPHPKGLRRNIFGEEDQLKVAPKGVSKDHPDIDLLKLRTIAVVHHFADKEVLKPAFNEEIVRIMEIMLPLVHVLNDMITLTPGEGESD